jgi:hypothetical protein
MVEGLARPSVLEIGIGAAQFACGLRGRSIGSYDGIEVSAKLIKRAGPLLSDLANQVPVALHKGPWQSLLPTLGRFDVVLYDTWPPEGCAEQDFEAFMLELTDGHLSEVGRLSFLTVGADAPAGRVERLKQVFEDVTVRTSTLVGLPPEWSRERPVLTATIGSTPRSPRPR